MKLVTCRMCKAMLTGEIRSRTWCKSKAMMPGYNLVVWHASKAVLTNIIRGQWLGGNVKQC